MNAEFLVLPFEHRGMNVGAQAHAQSRLEIGGRARQFLLKCVDGIVYFTEPNRAPTWATTSFFEGDLSDASALEKFWLIELKSGNFGRFTWKHLWFPKIGGSTVICHIHRGDRSGLVKEWFRPDWMPFGALPASQHFDVWADRVFLHYANRRAASKLLPSLLDAPFPRSQRPQVASQWRKGSLDELQTLLGKILRLYEPNGVRQNLRLNPHWPLGHGGVALDRNWRGTHVPLQNATQRLLQIVAREFVFVELKWANYKRNPRPHLEHYKNHAAVQSGLDKWGEDWRGNWHLRDSRLLLPIEPYSSPAAHERLELALQIGDWLRPRIGAARANRLLQNELTRRADDWFFDEASARAQSLVDLNGFGPPRS